MDEKKNVYANEGKLGVICFCCGQNWWKLFSRESWTAVMYSIFFSTYNPWRSLELRLYARERLLYKDLIPRTAGHYVSWHRAEKVCLVGRRVTSSGCHWITAPIRLIFHPKRERININSMYQNLSKWISPGSIATRMHVCHYHHSFFFSRRIFPAIREISLYYCYRVWSIHCDMTDIYRLLMFHLFLLPWHPKRFSSDRNKMTVFISSPIRSLMRMSDVTLTGLHRFMITWVSIKFSSIVAPPIWGKSPGKMIGKPVKRLRHEIRFPYIRKTDFGKFTLDTDTYGHIN